MKLEKIITLANQSVRLRFLAMERSLRATGCDLPLWVIPYDHNRFNLPPNATWWEMPDVRDLLTEHRAHPMMAKYQCFTTGNYQYVDSDVVFLRNPAEVLADQNGFITSCGHWGGPDHTYTADSLKVLTKITTGWQTRVFNAGQFACDRALYSLAQLNDLCCDSRYTDTCLKFPFHDQPGTVLLTNLSGVPIYNLTLPPVSMESTWAGSYPDDTFAAYWQDKNRKPYLLHWAGCDVTLGRPIDQLFIRYFTKDEREQWDQELAWLRKKKVQNRRSWKTHLRKLAKASKAFVAELQK